MRFAIIAGPIVAALGGWALIAMLGGAGAQTPSAPGLPRLTGIVVAGQHRVAIFEDPPGLTTAFEEGETVAAYTVRSIRPNGVQVEREGRSLLITLSQSIQPVVAVDAGPVFGRVVNPQRPPDD